MNNVSAIQILKVLYTCPPLNPAGEGLGERESVSTVQISCNTAFVFFNTSLFQKRSTRIPSASRARVRSASY
jgi:hypothetical protein